MMPRTRDLDGGWALGRPMLAQWRGRRLYARRPISNDWTTLVWMSGGVPLALLVGVVTLPALPLPERLRRRILGALLWCLGGCMAVAAVVALPGLDRLGANSLWQVTLVPVIASRLCGIGAHVAHGKAIAGAYRALEFWGGRTRGSWIFLGLPLAVGVVTDLAAFMPILGVVALVTGQGL
jgi:hypothetical protein